MKNSDNFESEEILVEVNDGKKDMLFGGLWCLGGIIVTIGTYAFASGGGTYVVAWGAIIFGAIQLIKGLMQAEKYKEAEAQSSVSQPKISDQKPTEPKRATSLSNSPREEAPIPKEVAMAFWVVFGIALVALIMWGRSRV